MTGRYDSCTSGWRASRRRPVGRLRGFTLIELMVTLGVLAVLLSIAVPSFQEVSLGSRLRSYANMLAASVQLARSEAIKRNAVVQLCASNDGVNCGGNWQQGWIVRAADGSVLLVQAALATGYMIGATKEGASAAVSTLNFPSSGVGLKLDAETASAGAEFRLCRASPSVGSQERKVRVSVSGHTVVERTNEGSCSAG